MTVDHKLSWLQRGDIIVFVPPGKNLPFIKRIIWLPWETVQVDDGKVFICDAPGEGCSELNETYLPTDTMTQASSNKSIFEIESGYFVMGDNRWHTTDSMCCFGLICTPESNFTVPENYIIGKVLYRVFPQSTRF